MKKQTSAEKPFLDTNILVYALASNNDKRGRIARQLLAEGAIIGVQQLNEFVAVVRRKLKRSWPEIKADLKAFLLLCPKPVPVTMEVHEHGLLIADRFRFTIYDSLMMAAALQSGCRTLLTEDLQDGMRIESLRIHNPFLAAGPPVD